MIAQTKVSEPPPPARMQRSIGVGRISVKLGADGTTRLRDLYQEGSARIRLPKSHSGGRLEAVLLNTSGGMTGGDRLSWDCEAGAGTHLTLASQTAERLYHAPSGEAATRIVLKAEAGASLHWLAQETIAFDRAAFSRTIKADLESDAALLICEPLVFGRAAMGEIVRTASLRDRWMIRQRGKLVHMEALKLDGLIAEKLQSPAVANGAVAHATVLLVGTEGEALVEGARQIIGETGGASYFAGKLVARLMETSALRLRHRLVPLLIHLRGGYALPRCWS